MLGFNVIAADTDEEAQFCATSLQQAFINLRRGHPTPLPPPAKDYLNSVTTHQRALLDEVLSCSAVGSAQTIEKELEAFIAGAVPTN